MKHYLGIYEWVFCDMEGKKTINKKQKSQSDTLNMCLHKGRKKKATCALNENTNETWPKSSNITKSLLRTGQTGKSSSTKGCMTRNYSCGVYSLHHKASPGRWLYPYSLNYSLRQNIFHVYVFRNKKNTDNTHTYLLCLLTTLKK